MLDRKVRSLERWLGLITALQGGRRLTVPELAERFGVSTRTIYRDLEALEHIGIPITLENGGYRILETWRLRPAQFTPDEVLTLVAALDFARRRRILGGVAAASAMEKLAALLPGPQQQLAAGLENLVLLDPVPAHSQVPAPEVEQALHAALRQQRRVRIAYAALGAPVPTERTVHPYGLVYRGTALYLIGYCELRRGLRTFRGNRIQAARVLAEGFARPSDFDLEAYLAGIWGIEDGPVMQVQIRFDRTVAQLALETQWHPSQQVLSQPDGSVLLTMETRGKNELARCVAGFGGAAQVLAPRELRAAVQALGRGIVARYEDVSGQ